MIAAPEDDDGDEVTTFNPVIIAESAVADTMNAFEEFGYNRVASERRSQNVQLIDLNREAKFRIVPLIDYDLHPSSIRN